MLLHVKTSFTSLLVRGGKNVAVLDSNDKEIRRISVPAEVNLVESLWGIDGNLYISGNHQRQVYTYNTEGKQLGVNDLQQHQAMLMV